MQFCGGSISTPFSAAVAGNYSITVHAGGQFGVGAWPDMQLIVDGAVQGSWNVDVWAPGTIAYSVSVSLSAGSHTLAVAFPNDAYDPSSPSPDRNLYISDAVITAPPAAAAQYTYTCHSDAVGDPGDHWQLVVAADGSKFVETYFPPTAQSSLWTFEWDFESKTATTITYTLPWWNRGHYEASLPLSALNGVGGFEVPGTTLGTCR
jgi:hypothetical protein